MTKTIYTISNTIPRNQIHNHVMACVDNLFCDHERLTVYVFIVNHVPYRWTSSLANGCAIPHQNANTYIVYVKPANWQWVLSHEMYHVYQMENDLPQNERECNQFADLIRDDKTEIL